MTSQGIQGKCRCLEEMSWGRKPLELQHNNISLIILEKAIKLGTALNSVTTLPVVKALLDNNLSSHLEEKAVEKERFK